MNQLLLCKPSFISRRSIMNSTGLSSWVLCWNFSSRPDRTRPPTILHLRWSLHSIRHLGRSQPPQCPYLYRWPHDYFRYFPILVNSWSHLYHIPQPAEVFPTGVRGTAHGISAAAGKCGAILTSFAFGTVEDAISLEGVLGLFSGSSCLQLWSP